MNTQDEKLDEMMRAWEQKKIKKAIRKYRIRWAIAVILIIIIWSYSIKIISEAHIKIKNTEWYEVKAECIESIPYEVESLEKVPGKLDYVRGKETRYSNVYEYTAKDGNVYTTVEKGTSAQEGSSTTYLVDEDNPEHAISALGEEEAYVVVVIIAGGMTFCILMVLTLLKPRALKKRKKC